MHAQCLTHGVESPIARSVIMCQFSSVQAVEHVRCDHALQYPWGEGRYCIADALSACLDCGCVVEQVSLIFGNQSEDDILLKKELDDMARQHKNFKVTNTLSAAIFKLGCIIQPFAAGIDDFQGIQMLPLAFSIFFKLSGQ